MKYLRSAFGKNNQCPDDKNSHERLDHGFKGSDEGETGTESMEVKTSRHFHTQGIHNAALRFNQGEFVGIVGNQGAGKTTLLRLLSGRLLCECKQVKGTMK